MYEKELQIIYIQNIHSAYKSCVIVTYYVLSALNLCTKYFSLCSYYNYNTIVLYWTEVRAHLDAS